MGTIQSIYFFRPGGAGALFSVVTSNAFVPTRSAETANALSPSNRKLRAWCRWNMLFFPQVLEGFGKGLRPKSLIFLKFWTYVGGLEAQFFDLPLGCGRILEGLRLKLLIFLKVLDGLGRA